MSGHRCAAVGCFVRVDDSLLMCWRHWRMVPIKTRTAVVRSWRALEYRRDSAANEAYVNARMAAIEAVAEQERAQSWAVPE